MKYELIGGPCDGRIVEMPEVIGTPLRIKQPSEKPRPDVAVYRPDYRTGKAHYEPADVDSRHRPRGTW